MKNYLNFETEIKDLENELEKLKDPFNQSGLSEVDTQKITKTQSELDDKLKSIYSNLDPWQTTMVARHEDRPKSNFLLIIYLKILFLYQVIDIMEKINQLYLVLQNLTETLFWL